MNIFLAFVFAYAFVCVSDWALNIFHVVDFCALFYIALYSSDSCASLYYISVCMSHNLLSVARGPRQFNEPSLRLEKKKKKSQWADFLSLKVSHLIFFWKKMKVKLYCYLVKLASETLNIKIHTEVEAMSKGKPSSKVSWALFTCKLTHSRIKLMDVEGERAESGEWMNSMYVDFIIEKNIEGEGWTARRCDIEQNGILLDLWNPLLHWETRIASFDPPFGRCGRLVLVVEHRDAL